MLSSMGVRLHWASLYSLTQNVYLKWASKRASNWFVLAQHSVQLYTWPCAFYSSLRIVFVIIFIWVFFFDEESITWLRVSFAMRLFSIIFCELCIFIDLTHDPLLPTYRNFMIILSSRISNSNKNSNSWNAYKYLFSNIWFCIFKVNLQCYTCAHDAGRMASVQFRLFFYLTGGKKSQPQNEINIV